MTGPDPLLDEAPLACPRCRADNPRQHRFCADCGQPLPLTCRGCGLAAEPGARFCGGCGRSLSPAAPRFASPDVYTPRHLAERIRTSRGTLTDERKQVTVLFADLKSSLQRLADRDPEEARQLLDPMIEAMMEAVHRYEGTVNQVLGDGIMANRIRERWGMAGLVSVGARLWLSASLSGVGEFAEALGRAREAVTLAEAANHSWSLGGARMALGSTLVSRGHLAEAVPVLEQGIAFSREMGITAWLPMLFSALGAARARGGHADEGVALLEEGVARARALSIVSRQSLRLTWLAEAYLLAGRLDDARATVQEAHRLAREHKEKAYEGWALRMSGELNADPAAAAELYRRALARADELNMRPLAALCHLGLASLSRRTGNTARGADHLSVALGLLRELDMRYWLERATTEPPVLG